MNRRTGIISVQARMGSTRLPGKVLLQIGQKRIIERVLEQCRKNTIVERIVLAIGDSPENDALVELCRRNGIDYVVGSENNLLQRHQTAANAVQADYLTRITGDCPFVPPQEIDRVVRTHRGNDAIYTTNIGDQVPDGIAVDVIDTDVLAELDDLGETHPVQKLRNNPQQWNVRFDMAEKWMKYGDVHMAVDTPDDYWLLVDALEAVGEDPMDIATWCQKQ